MNPNSSARRPRAKSLSSQLLWLADVRFDNQTTRKPRCIKACKHFQIRASGCSHHRGRRADVSNWIANGRFRNLSARYGDKLNLDAVLFEETLPLSNGGQYRAETDGFEAKQIDSHTANLMH
jgi:hypothetical protein